MAIDAAKLATNATRTIGLDFMIEPFLTSVTRHAHHEEHEAHGAREELN